MIHISRDLSDEADLWAAAFGGHPECWPLPAANTPRQLWLRAIAAGGQGRYGGAYADLASLMRRVAPGELASLALSARASFLRQLGWHGLARGWDGRALLLAGDEPEAVGDALTGLAADALGAGRLAASAALLARVAPYIADAPPRLAVRRAWIAAELAMVGGDAQGAVRDAEVAVELANAVDGAARHRVKSQVVLAAALACAGDVDRAREVADGALELAGRLALVPLRWALACLLIDLPNTDGRAAELRVVRDGCALRVEHWGGTWRRT